MWGLGMGITLQLQLLCVSVIACNQDTKKKKAKQNVQFKRKTDFFVSTASPFPCCIVSWFLKCREMHTAPRSILTFLDLRVFKNADKIQLLSVCIYSLSMCLTDLKILVLSNICMGTVF